jgi:nucleoside diphosphate kinase
VLAAPSPDEAEIKLKLWAKHSATDGGYLDKVIAHDKPATIEETLVMLKPDNFRFPSARPGNIVDMLSRTGLYIVAIKVHHMSIGEALEFYGPVREVLQRNLRDVSGDRARIALEKEFGFGLTPEITAKLAEIMGDQLAKYQFNKLVEFMTGRDPARIQPGTESQPGADKILAVVYQGPDAVTKIRSVLGPTDPRKAPPGTVRRELGQDIMVNAAHASDSAANARREMGIINIVEDNLRPLVEEFYRCKL